MLRIDRRLLQNVDWALLAIAFGLVVMSTLTLASLHVGRAGGSVVVRQVLWFAVGLTVMVLLASLDYRRLVRAAPALYLLGLAGLAAVFVLGRTVSGARRWIVFGPMSIQPSELFKICFVLIVVWALASRWAQPVGKLTIALILPIVAVPAVLIIKQPDLGTALLLVPVLTILLVGAGLRLKVLGGLALAALSAMPLAWLALKDY
ncbi:MAG: rod shape-determining protein RodA, partial [Candidatus Rokuibacteriota bacterium]